MHANQLREIPSTSLACSSVRKKKNTRYDGFSENLRETIEFRNLPISRKRSVLIFFRLWAIINNKKKNDYISKRILILWSVDTDQIKNTFKKIKDNIVRSFNNYRHMALRACKTRAIAETDQDESGEENISESFWTKKGWRRWKWY